MRIKEIINRIIDDQLNMHFTDAGNGSGGPGIADPEMLQAMLDEGQFDDAEIVEYDPELHSYIWELVTASKMDSTDPTKWIQIEFDWGEGQNPYHMIGWIWEE